MTKQLKAGLQYMLIDFRYSLMIFWSILFASSLLLMLLSWSIPSSQSNLAFGLVIYIFCAISGFQMTKETLPYFLKFSSTRKNFLIVALVFNVLLAMFMSLLAMLSTYLFNYISRLFDIANFRVMFTTELTTLSQTWYHEFFTNAVLSFLFLTLGFLLSSLFYRFGLIGGFSGLAVVIISIILPESRQFLADLFLSIDYTKVDFNFLVILFVSLFTFIPNWLLIKQAPTKAASTR